MGTVLQMIKYITPLCLGLIAACGPLYEDAPSPLLDLATSTLGLADDTPTAPVISPEIANAGPGDLLLVTLTAGVGGSLLSVGSAAGVALMGQTKGAYTFFSHLKWTPLIFLGYGLSILTHYFVNS